VYVPGGGAVAPLRIVAVETVTLPAVIVQVGAAENTVVTVNGVTLVTMHVVSAVLNPEPVIETV
jgi:hypothetical protein